MGGLLQRRWHRCRGGRIGVDRPAARGHRLAPSAVTQCGAVRDGDRDGRPLVSRALRGGVGHGVQDWMGQAGARVGSPLTLLGEYLTALHGLLGGETVTIDGRYVRLTDVRLDWPPTPAPRLFGGGYG